MPRFARFHDNTLVKSRKTFVLASGPALSRLLRGIGPCAEAVVAARAGLRADMGIGPATLRLMDRLDNEGPRAVPALAAGLGVSRQAVQPLVDARIRAGHVELLPNARSRRSPLVRLTDDGRAIVAAIMRREGAFDAWMATRFLEADIAIAQRTLANLIRACADADAFAAARARDRAGDSDPPP